MQNQKLKDVRTQLPPHIIQWLEDLARYDHAGSRSKKIRQIIMERYGENKP